MSTQDFINETSIALALSSMVGESVRSLSTEACTQPHIAALIEANNACTRLMMALNELKAINAIAGIPHTHPPPA